MKNQGNLCHIINLMSVFSSANVSERRAFVFLSDKEDMFQLSVQYEVRQITVYFWSV